MAAAADDTSSEAWRGRIEACWLRQTLGPVEEHAGKNKGVQAAAVQQCCSIELKPPSRWLPLVQAQAALRTQPCTAAAPSHTL